VYFCLVMLAYARLVLRQSISASAAKQSTTTYTSASASANMAENPFAEGRPEGQGWRGRLGRAMVSVGRTYWLGSDEDDSWMNGMGGKFRKSGDLGAVENGPLERERRRRSGTGPPAVPPQLAVKMQDMA